MNDVIPIEVDFAINKDNFYLLGEPHTKILVDDSPDAPADLFIIEKRVWKIIEKSTKVIIFIEAEINCKKNVSNMTFNLKYDDVDSLYHSSYGPAAIFYKEEKLVEEAWFLNGLCHRSEAPAVIGYDLHGKVDLIEWWIEDKRVE